MTKVPASIRSNNPGAMWGGTALTRKWGETHHESLSDGLHQGNQIAFFPDKVHGACAQFDLWRTSKNYRGKTLNQAIETWSGGNSWPGYVHFLTSRVPGLTGGTVVDDELLSGPRGAAMMKAQAQHEAGVPYPMSDEDWLQAQRIVFGGGSAVSVSEDDSSPLIRPGDGGSAVQEMQNLLGVEATGHYDEGSETEYALRLFQTRSGLKPDGKCGELTWEKLREQHKDARE